MDGWEEADGCVTDGRSIRSWLGMTVEGRDGWKEGRKEGRKEARINGVQ